MPSVSRSRGSWSPHECVCRSSQKTGSLAVPYLTPQLIRKRRSSSGTSKIAQIGPASPRGCILAARIPLQAFSQQPETIKNAHRCIPNLYVPPRVFGPSGIHPGRWALTQSDALSSQTDAHPEADLKPMLFAHKLLTN